MAKKVNKTFTKPRRVEEVSLAKSGLLDEIKDETSEDGCSSVRSDLQEDQEASSVDRKLPLLNHCDHHSLLPSLHLSALMRLNEEPPLSSSVTTTRGSSRAIESIRNGSERWRRGGLTTNLRHHILHRVRCSRNLFSDFLYFSKTSKSSDKSRRIDYNTQRVNKSQ
ncbi:hypothetical protein Bca4012_079705 [Brassica carinata]